MRLGQQSGMHSGHAQSLLLHPWNTRDSHSSNIVVVMRISIIVKRLGVAPAPNSVTTFENIDVGNSEGFQHHCKIETGNTGSDDANTTLVGSFVLEIVSKLRSHGKSLVVQASGIIQLSKKVLVQDMLCICSTERRTRRSHVEGSLRG